MKSGGEISGFIRSNTGLRTAGSPPVNDGTLGLDGLWRPEEGWLRGFTIAGEADGHYYLRLDGENQTILPSLAWLEFSKENIDLRGGLFLNDEFGNFRRILGGRLGIANSWLRGVVYGGRELRQVWRDGIPQPDFNHSILGALLLADGPQVGGRIGYEMEMRGDGEIREQIASGLLRGKLWDSGFIPFAGADLFLVSGGHELTIGARLALSDQRILLEPSYVRSNLAPFFREFNDLPGTGDDRGRLSASWTPLEWLVATTSGEVGRHGMAARFGVDLTYAGAVFLYRRDGEGLANGVGANFFGRLPIGERASIAAYAALNGESDETLSQDDDRLSFDGGLRLSLGAWDRLLFSGSGGYSATPLGQSGPYFMVHLAAGAGWSEESRPEGSKPLQPSFPSQGSAEKFAAVVKPRSGGKFLAETASAFDHSFHSEVEDKGGPISCPTCHTVAPLFQVAEETKKETCSECHAEELDNIFKTLASVPHPGATGGELCQNCHGTIESLAGPTNGWGSIILNPHRSEIWTAGKIGWQDHGKKQEAACSTCHSGRVQYQERLIPACRSCHDEIAGRANVSQTPHPMGWRVTHANEARFDARSCTTCHEGLSFCRSCHQEEGIRSNDFHHGVGLLRFDGETMRHGLLGRSSGGTLCGACHAPADFQAAEGGDQLRCGRCHDQ